MREVHYYFFVANNKTELPDPFKSAVLALSISGAVAVTSGWFVTAMKKGVCLSFDMAPSDQCGHSTLGSLLTNAGYIALAIAVVLFVVRVARNSKTSSESSATSEAEITAPTTAEGLCHSCSAELQATQRFCVKCGASVSAP